jgi:hypoxanthine phosphoribosyltransferase
VIENQLNLWKRDRLLMMSWSTFGVALDTLKVSVRSLKPRPNVIVGIGRGGWMIAVPLSHALEVTECYGIRIIRNASEQVYASRTDPIVLQRPPGAALNNQTVLLVDDIAGDGGTIEAAKEALIALGAKAVQTAVLVLNAAGNYPVDAYAVSVDDWVIFPWERGSAKPGKGRDIEMRTTDMSVKSLKERRNT